MKARERYRKIPSPALCWARYKGFRQQTLDFEPTAEQKEFGERARRFAQEVIRVRPARHEEAGMVPEEIVRQLGELQMMSAAVPPEEGGGGKGHVGYVLALMEISKASASLGAAVFVNNSLYCHSLLEFEKKEQRARYLRPCLSGEGIGSVGENHPISDPNAVRIRALRSGSGWILSGRQDLRGNGVLPSHCILPVETGKGSGSVEISLFVLDLRNGSGVRSVAGAETVNLHLENCAVDEDGLLGEPGKGLKYLMNTRPKNWIGLAAHSVGVGRAFLERAVDFSLKRGLSGKAAFSSQAVQWVLADAAVGLDAAELLTIKAAWLVDRSKPFEKEAAMAKLYGSDGAMKAALETAQIMGEEGLDRTNSLWELMRQAKKCQIEQESNLRIKGVITGHLVRDLKGSI